MPQAWLVIQSIGGAGPGTQIMVPGHTYEDIQVVMRRTLDAIGAVSGGLVVEPGRNTEGDIICCEDGVNPTGLGWVASGLRWLVCPCYADGCNVDYGEPVEPRGDW